MHKILFYAFSMAVVVTLNGYGKTWKVGGLVPDFQTLQEANDSSEVMDEDMILVHGGLLSYGDLTLTKNLKIYGPGYFLDENPQTQMNLQSAKTGRIIFNSGSEGAIISGLEIQGSSNRGISINVNNITITRNYIHVANTGSSSDYVVESDDDLTNISITQNFIQNTASSGNSSIDTIEIGDNNSSILISNNFISSSAPTAKVINCPNVSSSSILNNVLLGGVEGKGITFINNVLRSGDFAVNGVVQYNICNADQLPDDGTNKLNIDIETVFVGGDSPDGQWQVSEVGPAKGMGFNGQDIGMFGGDSPYVLSGIPTIPSVYELGVSGPTNGSILSVTIKAKSNN